MKIAIASIQRNRNPYIVEWIAFHLSMGFNQFYIYCHKTTDGMTDRLLELGKHYPIHVLALEEDNFPQIHAYQHAWSHFGKAVDWMAFIDGDEFLFPTQAQSMQEALAPYNDKPLSALGVYWKCYGSNGHVADPSGLVLENYPRHSRADFSPNRHIKSIVKGGADANPNRSHLFETALGTFDEHLRPITHGSMLDYEPTYDHFRINHYVVQSRDFFFKVKQGMGAADLPQGVRRQDDFFSAHDRNEEDDGVARSLLPQLKAKVAELEHYLSAHPTMPAAAGLQAVVHDYRLIRTIPPGEYRAAPNSVGLKEIVAHIFPQPQRSVAVLDVGSGQGDLGRFIKTQPALRHWHVDGIDSSWDACCNTALNAKGFYRNIWHGWALDLPATTLQSFDVICLFGVLEHLGPASAKQLLSDLLKGMGTDARLVIGTPLWLGHQSSNGLEENRIGVPAQSLLGLAPTMFHIQPKTLVGTFVFTQQSLAFIDSFLPTEDRAFDLDAGLKHLHSLGRQADGVLNFVRPPLSGSETSQQGLFVHLPALEAHIDGLIAQEQHEDALVNILMGVHNYNRQTELARKSLFLPGFDRQLMRLAQDVPVTGASPRPLTDGTLIIASQIHPVGGHSRVLVDVARATSSPTVVLTDAFGTFRKKPEDLTWAFSVLDGIAVIVLTQLTLWDKCKALALLTQRLQPRDILYFNNHEDPVPFVGTLEHAGSCKTLIHHCDHSPSLGSTVTGLQHVDFTDEAAHTCAHVLQRDAKVLPLYAPDGGRKQFRPIEGGLYSVVTSGTHIKFARDGDIALHNIVRTVLSSIQGVFFHIGALAPDWIEAIQSHLVQHRIDPARFVYLGAVNSVWETLLGLDAHVYLGSAPVGGGRASIEAQGCGYPVAFFRVKDQGAVLGADSIYANKHLGWANPAELSAVLQSLGADHARLSQAARQWYEKYYTQEAFVRTLSEFSGGNAQATPHL